MQDNTKTFDTRTFDQSLDDSAVSSSKTGWIVSAALLLTVVGIVVWLIMSD